VIGQFLATYYLRLYCRIGVMMNWLLWGYFNIDSEAYSIKIKLVAHDACFSAGLLAF